MRNHCRFHVLLLVLLAFAGPTPSKAATYVGLSETDLKALEWCDAHFPLAVENPQTDKDSAPPSRPVKHFPPFDMKEMLAPPDLVKETEIVGTVSPSVTKYQGLWIWPTISIPSPVAVFVELLTPTEMTFALVRREPNPDYKRPDPLLRFKLKWNGETFLEETGDPDVPVYQVRISQDGQAMLVVLAGKTETTHVLCLISSKHY